MSRSTAFGRAYDSCYARPAPPAQPRGGADAVTRSFDLAIPLTDQFVSALGSNGMFARASLKAQPGFTDPDKNHCLILYMQAGPFDNIAGMSGLVAFLALFEYYRFAAVTLTLRAGHIDENGQVVIIGMAAEQAAKKQNLSQILANPRAIYMKPNKDWRIGVDQLTYRITDNELGFKTGLFPCPINPDYLSKLRTNETCPLAILLYFNDCFPVFQPGAEFNLGLLMVTVTVEGTKPFLAEMYEDNVPPSLVFGRTGGGLDGSVKQEASIFGRADYDSPTAKHTDKPWFAGKASAVTRLWSPPRYISTPTRAFSLGSLAATFGTLAGDIVGALFGSSAPAGGLALLKDSLTLRYMNGQDPDLLTPLAEGEVGAELGAVFGSDGVELAQHAVVLTPLGNWELLAATHERFNRGGVLVPAGARKTLVAVLSNEWHRQVPAATDEPQLMAGAGFSPNTGAYAGAAYTAESSTGAGAFTAFGTLHTWQKLIPTPDAHGGAVQTAANIIGKVAGAASKIGSMASSIVQLLGGDARTGYKLTDKTVQTWSTAFASRGDTASGTVVKTYTPDPRPAYFFPSYRPGESNPYFGAYTEVVGTPTATSTQIVLRHDGVLHVRLMAGEILTPDTTWVLNPSDVGTPRGRKPPGMKDVHMRCPITSRVLRVEIVASTWFGFRPASTPALGCRDMSTPMGGIGYEVHRTILEENLITLSATDAYVVTKSGSKLPIASIAIFDAKLPIGAHVVTSPPTEYMSADGVIHKFEAGEKIAWDYYSMVSAVVSGDYGFSVSGVQEGDNVYWSPAPLWISFDHAANVYVTGNVGTAVASNPGQGAGDVYAVTTTERYVLDRGTFTGVVDDDGPMILETGTSLSAASVEPQADQSA
jgi:hypothetical protein